MKEFLLQQYREYLQLKGYRPRSIKKMLAQARAHENEPHYYPSLRQRVEAQTLSPNTFNHYVFCLKSYFTFLEETGWQAPAYKLLKEKKRPTPTEILTVGECKGFLRPRGKNRSGPPGTGPCWRGCTIWD